MVCANIANFTNIKNLDIDNSPFAGEIRCKSESKDTSETTNNNYWKTITENITNFKNKIPGCENISVTTFMIIVVIIFILIIIVIVGFFHSNNKDNQ